MVYDGCVQRPVEIVARGGDVIVKRARHWPPHLVNFAQRLITGGNIFEHHRQPQRGIDLIAAARTPVAAARLVDGVNILRRKPDIHHRNIGLRQPFRNLVADFREGHLVLVAQLFQPLADVIVGIGVQHFQRQRFQIVLHVPHAQAVGQWGINGQRLFCLAPLCGRRRGLDGAHVVQAVEQLDDAHPHILGHHAKQLVQRGVAHLFLRQLIARGIVCHRLKLGQAVYQVAHLVAKTGLDFIDRNARILHDVV